MQHRITLARQQRVDVHAGVRGHALEALALQLVRDEDRALCLRQLVQGALDFGHQPAAHELGVRSCVG